MAIFKPLVSCCLLTVLVSLAQGSEPYVPADDSVVLEKLPQAFRSADGSLRQLQKQLSQTPQDSRLAAKVANHFLEAGRTSSDPRFQGYARFAIAPWWDTDSAPAEILLVRAKLKEKDHEYAQAIEDLKAYVVLRPDSAQAWFDLANIYRVRGEYALALDACDELAQCGGDTLALLCRSSIHAVSGRAKEANDQLAEISDELRAAWPSTTTWVLTIQAQLAWSLGELPQAEQFIVEGLDRDPSNTYLLRLYADFLLDRGQNKDVVQLLREHLGDNGALLRAAIAAKRSGQTEMAAQWQATLNTRFREIRLRGDQPHGRFESRYELQLNDNPQRALEIALTNWGRQKELRDARNALEAAVAADDPLAVAPVLEFLRKHQTQDAELQRLAQQLER